MGPRVQAQDNSGVRVGVNVETTIVVRERGADPELFDNEHSAGQCVHRSISQKSVVCSPLRWWI